MRTSGASPAGRRLIVAGVETFFFDVGPEQPGRTDDVPVVCLHGNPDSADVWSALLEQTGQIGRVIAPDLPGFGRSQRPDPSVFSATVDAYVRWFEAFLDALEIDRFRLVVHDWGGLALSAASRRPAQVDRLVAIDVVPLSAAYRWHWIARFLWRPPIVGEVGMKIFNRFTAKTITRLPRPGFRPIDARLLDNLERDLDPGMKDAILRLYRSADPDVLGRHGADLGRLTCPTMLIWGDADPYIKIDQMLVVKEALGGPTVCVTVSGGHWSMFDSPVVFAETLAFLGPPSGSVP